MNLSLESITSTDRLEDLHDEWNALLPRSESKHFALTHEWLSSWWQSFGDGKNLRVVTVREDGDLVCVAPLMESTVSLPGRGPFGLSLKRLGSLRNFYNPLCDFILASHGRSAIKLVWEHLVGNSHAWDFFEVLPMPMLSQPLLELERMARAAGFWTGLHELAPSPFADTSGTWESYLATRSPNWRKDCRRHERRAAEKGGAELLYITNPAELDRYLPIALEIEASGWKGKAGTAIAQDPHALSLYTSFASLAARNGWFRLAFLKSAQTGELIAFQYDIMFERVIYSEKVGYLEERSSVAPGKLLQKLALEECFRGPAQRYVFEAPPDPFKMSFATGLERRFRLRVYNRNPKGFILFATDCIVIPVLKKLRALAQSRSPAEFWRRVVTAFRDNLFDFEPVHIYEKDLRSIQPVSPKVPGVAFELAPADEIYSVAADPEYMFSRGEALQIHELARERDLCIVGKIEKKIVFYQWVRFNRHVLSEGKALNLGGVKPFIFRARTLDRHRGKNIFPAAISYAYRYLRSHGFSKCYLDVSGRNTPSIRAIEKTSAKLIGRFRILSIFGKRRAIVPKRLLTRISVTPYWCS